MKTEPTPVLEFASFRLAPGADRAAFLQAARATEALLRARGTLVRRDLAVDDDGLWTDVVQWRSMAEAKSAAQHLMREPGFLAFVQNIDPASVTMRHADILWQME